MLCRFIDEIFHSIGIRYNEKRIFTLLLLITCCVVILFPRITLASGGQSTNHVNNVVSKAASLHNAITIKEKNGLITLVAKQARLDYILAEVSRVSKVPILLIDKESSKKRISVNIANKSVVKVVSEVMATLPAGGYLSVSNAGKTKRIYIISKEGAKSFQGEMQKLIDRIRKGEKPKPEEVKKWLLAVAKFGFPVDVDGTGMFMFPVLQLMDKNYNDYKAVALSIFSNTDTITPLRFAMEELLGRHWDDPDSRQALRDIFNRPDDNEALQGRISLALAGHGDDITARVLKRYAKVSAAARFYYAQTLGMMGDKKAVPLLQADAESSNNSALRTAALSALIKVDPNSKATRQISNIVIHSTKAQDIAKRTASDLDNESVAMNAVMAIGQSRGVASTQNLLRIANDATVAVDVRLTALESIFPNVRHMTKSEVTDLRNKLGIFKKSVSGSSQLNQMNKERMKERIIMLHQAIMKQENKK